MYSWDESNLDLIQCPIDRWGGEENMNKSLNFGLAYCAKDINFTVQGSMTSKLKKMFSVGINFC
jgi:hypothetical protein